MNLKYLSATLFTMLISTVGIAQDYDYSLADSANKRAALEYIYMAYNEGEFAAAREQYYDAEALAANNAQRLAQGKSLTGPGPIKSGDGNILAKGPQYSIKRVIEEDNVVVVLAFVEGIGIGKELTTLWGTPAGTKIGDAVVEIIQFNDAGKILQKWDTIEELSEASYDFR